MNANSEKVNAMLKKSKRNQFYSDTDNAHERIESKQRASRIGYMEFGLPEND